MNFFKKLFKLGNTYACVTGDYAGQLLIYMESNNTHKGFLSSPKMENVWVPKESFDFGLNNGIIEFVERVPHEVRKISEIKFKENEAKRL